MLILDVGCGENPRGTVNCDIAIGETKHFMKLGYGQKAGSIDPKLARIPNFFRCDSRFLPFKDNTFDLCLCSHMLEHMRDWQLAFKEVMRVCKHKAIFKVPHKLSRSGKFIFYRLKDKTVHVTFFDMVFWHKYLYGKYRYIITLAHNPRHDKLIDIFLPFLCPIEIVVEVWK